MTNSHVIIVVVRGGVVQDVRFPEGCCTAVHIHDYDVDGTDQAALDPDDEGHVFSNARWEPPADSQMAGVLTGVGEIDELPVADVRNILAQVFRWMYWNPNTARWDLDKDVSGADTVQFLCELLPYPP